MSRVERLIVHPGMPKAGSTSIQFALGKLKSPTHSLIPWGNYDNQLMAFNLAFSDDIGTIAEIEGLSGERLAEARRQSREGFEAAMKAVEVPYPIVSAESILERGRSSYLALREASEPLVGGYKVICYVRGPRAWSASILQQELKYGRFPMLARVPNLYAWSELDEVFGRENVEFVAFRSDKFKGGDLVSDFFERAGIAEAPPPAIRENESLSLEACGILFAQHVHGRFENGAPLTAVSRSKVAEFLRDIGDRKMSLHPSVFSSTKDAMRQSYGSIAGRMGADLYDVEDEPEDAAIQSEDMLKRFGADALPLLIARVDSLRDDPREFHEPTVDAAIAAARSASPGAEGVAKIIDAILSADRSERHRRRHRHMAFLGMEPQPVRERGIASRAARVVRLKLRELRGKAS